MKRFATALSVVLLAGVLASPASGQFTIGVGGGPVSPRAKLAEGIEGIDVLDGGYHAVLTMTLKTEELPWTLRGDLDYQSLSAPDNLQDYRHVAGTLAARLVTSPLGPMTPYALVGAGIYISDYTGDASVLAPGWKADAGLNFGAGAMFTVGRLKPFLDIRFHRVVAYSPRSFMPITFGLAF